MKIRIKFSKHGSMKFVGHLDLMRFFQKAIRMSGIDICYSKGFRPHPVMSFAAPLGVGLTSDGEYLDIEAHTSRSSKDAMDALNAVMPEGLKVTGYIQLDDHAKTAMSVVKAADYEIWYRQEYEMPPQLSDQETFQALLRQFYTDREEVLITKKTKKSEKVMDFKQLIYEMRMLEPQKKYLDRPALYVNVCTGSTDNVKPELVLEAFYEFAGLNYNPYAMQIRRRDVYETDEAGGRRPLLAAGKPL